MQQWRAKSADAQMCSLCHDSVRKAVRLPCQHIYCNTCMLREFEKRQGHQTAHDTLSTLMCPYCRDFFSTEGGKKQAATNDRPVQKEKEKDRKPERCQPCQKSGEYTPACFWCTVCKEYFCSLCSKYHRSMKMSKDHTMKSAKDVQEAKPEKTPRPHTVVVEKPTCDPCRQRKKQKIAKLVCPRCSEKFCDDCAQCHRSMKMSKTHKLVPVKEERPKPDIYGNSLMCHAHYGEALSLYCKRCLTSCCSICAITKHSKCGAGGVRVDMSASLARHARPLERSSSAIEYESNKEDGYYREKTPAKIKFDSSATANGSFTDAYLAKKVIEKRARSKSPSGKSKPLKELRMENRKMRINFGGSANGDWVISMAVRPNGDILLIELYQSELKLIDSTGNVLASCPFYADPWAITIVNDRLAAVTFSDRNQIRLVNMKPGQLTAGKTLPTKHKCLGICAANRYLVTTCWEGCVHVISLTGSEMFSIKNDCKGGRLFTNPEYIATNPAEDEIYVSDYKRNTVTALYMSGYKIDPKPKWVFSDKDLKGPKGVAVDADGAIYVSGMTSRNIVRVSPDGKKLQTFSRREDAENYEAIYVSPEADKMLVSAYEDNTILVFKLHTGR